MRIIIKKARIEKEVTTWYLGTDLEGERATTIIGYYERRMGIEATFKDLKSDLGWGKQKLLTSAERVSKYLLLLVTGLIISTLMGESKIAFKYKELFALSSVHNNKNTMSSFKLGLKLIQHFADRFTAIYLRKGLVYAA